MDKDGRVVEVEEQVPIESLSHEVGGTAGEGQQRQARQVESLTKKGKPVAYEAQVQTNGKRSEVQVGPEGQPLSHEE